MRKRSPRNGRHTKLSLQRLSTPRRPWHPAVRYQYSPTSPHGRSTFNHSQERPLPRAILITVFQNQVPNSKGRAVIHSEELPPESQANYRPSHRPITARVTDQLRLRARSSVASSVT